MTQRSFPIPTIADRSDRGNRIPSVCKAERFAPVRYCIATERPKTEMTARTESLSSPAVNRQNTFDVIAQTGRAPLIIPRSQVRSLPAPPCPASTTSDQFRRCARSVAFVCECPFATACYCLLLNPVRARSILRLIRPLWCARRRIDEGPSSKARRRVGAARVRRERPRLQS